MQKQKPKNCESGKSNNNQTRPVSPSFIEVQIHIPICECCPSLDRPFGTDVDTDESEKDICILKIQISPTETLMRLKEYLEYAGFLKKVNPKAGFEGHRLVNKLEDLLNQSKLVVLYFSSSVPDVPQKETHNQVGMIAKNTETNGKDGENCCKIM